MTDEYDSWRRYEDAKAFKFFKWAYENGDKIADELDYVPLSKDLKNSIVKEFN